MKLTKIIIVVAAAAFGITPFWYIHALSAVDASDNARQMVTIPKGSTVSSIAKALAEKEVIRSPLAFRLYARFHGIAEKMKAGGFVFKKSQDVAQIADVLTRGYGDEVTVTIPEGYTVEDIDALLTEQGLIQSGELVACAKTCDFSAYDFLPKGSGASSRGGRLEGYLFPDTYFVLQGEFEPKAFLERLLTTFRRRVPDALGADMQASGHSLHDVLVMASLVEKETKTDEERPVVAEILWKRLDAGMYLGVDAALRYGLGKPTDTITKDDLESVSVYNLRKVKGLPPGAICNPGLESIKAALHPKGTEYWYYLHDRNGRIHYAVTNDEHNLNRAKYLQ